MRSYEELSGARGREIFYRPERFPIAHLFKRGPPTLTLETDHYTLRDISLTGLGATTGRGTNHVPAVGRRVALRLDIRDVPLFEGCGEVIHVEPLPAGTRLGLRVVDRRVDISAILTRYQESFIAADLDERESEAASVSPAYRQLCSDVLHLLRSYRAVLDRFQASQPEPGAAQEMLAACEERIIPRWHALWRHGNQVAASLERGSRLWKAAKRYTELVLTPDFCFGAFARRCYEKPLGYPGDYEVMNMAYDWRREGERLSDKLVHRVGLEVGECIANRMIIMRQAIAELVASSPLERLRIASLGSGPAREIIDYLRIPALPRPVEFTLIDQDHSALSQAYERSLSDIMRHNGQAKISCLQGSFAQLLKTGELFGRLPQQDLIYSVGLIDYLTARRAKELLESLYGHLAPGGKLIVANMKSGPFSTYWPVEFITDWTLAYRDDGDMLALGRDLPGAALSTAEDRTGRVVILTVRKPLH